MIKYFSLNKGCSAAVPHEKEDGEKAEMNAYKLRRNNKWI